MRVLYASLLLVGFAVPGCCQSFVPKSIFFEGAPEYRQDQLLAAAGLTLGKPLTQADLDAATGRLGDSGLFSEVNYQTSGLALTFSLKSSAPEQMQPVAFANFVMFQQAELLAGVEQRVPLFAGKVPTSSPMQQRVERALEAMLKEKGIRARVDSIGTPGGKLDYSIASPAVKVASLDVAGADWDGMPALKTVRDRIVGSDYTEAFSGAALQSNLLDAYRDMGYMDAAVADITHGSVQVEPEGILVPLNAKATSGPLYTVTRVELPGTVPGVTVEQIAATAQIKVGGPASRLLVLNTAARLKALYTGHGYLDATTSIEPAKDVPAHTLAYTFHAEPGEVYHMRALGIRGLTEAQGRSAKGAWKLATGAVFEQALVVGFGQAGPGSMMCDSKPVDVALAVEHTAHQVDVVLSCAGSYSSEQR